MVSSESPAVARRRLRLALRRAREAKGLTQGQIAEALEWSLSKVNRIENGDVTISHTDLRALLALLTITDDALIDRLTDEARASRRRGWWDEPQYREHLSPATMQLLQFETEATAIRSFQATLVPGLLQTRAYAEAVVNFWGNELSEAARVARLEVRMRRSRQVLGRTNPPQCLVILDESVLLRAIGGPKVMAQQLQEMDVVIQNPPVVVRVVPLGNVAAAMIGPFTVFDLGDEENAVLYRESDMLDDIAHASDTVRRYRHIFEQMWELSLSQEASARLIRARAAVVPASLDRGSAG